ncbi:MAG: hypothetical protein NVSMB1_11230 [Polyangiales bacterium]
MLCAISIAVFLLAERAGSTQDVDTLVRFGASERSHIWQGQYWRLFTPMFLHIGWIHLLWNVYGIGGWCMPVEKVLGSGRFLLAYLLCGIFASASSVLFHDAVAAGASGAGFGIVGVTFAIRYDRLGSLRAFVNDRAIRSMVMMTGIWIVLGFSAIRMDNFAHIGGLFFGVIVGALYTRTAGWDRFARTTAWGMAMTLFLFMAVAASKRWPRQQARWGAAREMIAAYDALDHQDAALALRHLDDAERYGNQSAELYFSRGFAEHQVGNLPAALLDYQRALDLAPSDWSERAKVREALESLRNPPQVVPSSPASSSSAK